MATKSKLEIGKQIKFQTNNGAIVGTVIGKNDKSNFILRVDKRSPVKGFPLGAYDESIVTDYVEDRYTKGLKSYTYWHISPLEEVEEATEADLLPDGKAEEKLEAKAVLKAEQPAMAESRFDGSQWQTQTIKFTGSDEQKKEMKPMSDKKSATQIMKADGQNAAYRVAGKRLGQGANLAITKMFKSMLPETHGEAVESIMKTPAGTMITQLALGWGLTYAPGPAQDARIQKLAEEFRVQGTAEGMDLVVGGLMEHLKPMLNDALQMLPGSETTTQARVATTIETKAPALTEENEEMGLEDIQAEPKRAAAGK